MVNPDELPLDESENEKNFNDMLIEFKNNEKNIDNDYNLININLETVKNFEKNNYFKVIYPSNFSNKANNNFVVDEKNVLLAGKRKKFPESTATAPRTPYQLVKRPTEAAKPPRRTNSKHDRPT